MNILSISILSVLGIIAIAITAFVALVFLEAAFGSDTQDMFDLEEEDF